MKASILAKLDLLAERYEEVGALLSDSEIISDQDKFRGLSKEYAELEPVVQTYERFQETVTDIDEAKNLLKDADPDMRAMASEEVNDGEAKQEELELDLQRLLLPKDPNDGKNVFLEIRAGTGGDEAAIFSGDLFRMYSKFAENNRWKIEVISENQGDHGGLSLEWLVRGCTLNLNLSLAPIVFKEFLIPSLRGEFIHLLARSLLWPKPMKKTRLRSISQIFG